MGDFSVIGVSTTGVDCPVDSAADSSSSSSSSSNTSAIVELLPKRGKPSRPASKGTISGALSARRWW